MKKLLIISFIFQSLNLSAKSHYMTLSFGTSNPVGEYSEKKELNTNGFAEPGFLAGYSGVYFITKHLGLQGNMVFASNQHDANIVRNKMKELFLNDYPDDDITGLNIENSWNHVSMLIGPQLTLPLGKICLDVFATGGLNVIISPHTELTAVVEEDPFFIIYSSSKAAFGINIGASLRYNFSENYGLILHTSYFNSKFKHKLNFDNRISSYNMSVILTNFGIGIVYRL